MVVERPITHSNPAVSVVIPTLPENELEAVSALTEQSDDEFEVIVVSDASLSRTEARNRGIEEASADIVAQTDDDCAPPYDWIETIKRHFETDPELVLLEGPLDKHWNSTNPRHYIGANMAYRRRCALTIGGFDPEFDGWRADTDFGFRMELEYGVNRCKYDPDMEVVHIGPLRTDVDRELEQKFRLRYPYRYFTVIYRPDVPFGKELGMLMAKMYQISPEASEKVLNFIKRYQPIFFSEPTSRDP